MQVKKMKSKNAKYSSLSKSLLVFNCVFKIDKTPYTTPQTSSILLSA